MRYAILSDIHGNLEALEKVLAELKKEEIKEIICLGDVVGYYTNPNECVALVKSTTDFCLRGNHERAVTEVLSTLDFNPAARAALAWTKKELTSSHLAWLRNLPDEKEIDGLFLAVHGAPGDPDAYIFSAAEAGEAFQRLQANFPHLHICFYGHTHQKALWSTKEASVEEKEKGVFYLGEEGYYLLNPGSVGQPRDGETGAFYLIFSSQERTVAWRRVTYDFQLTQRKVFTVGLPPFLATRLAEGI